MEKKVKREKVKKEKGLVEVGVVNPMLFGESRKRCKICENSMLRYMVMEMFANGLGLWKIRDELRKRGMGVSVSTIESHINEHEDKSVAWLGLVRHKFGSEEERKKFESGFLARVSFVIELWDKYRTVSKLFEIVAGSGENVNEGAVKRLQPVVEMGRLVKDYLIELVKLQRERDVVVEVAKVVLFMMADSFVKKLAVLVSDMNVEKREIIGRLLQDEVKNALEYAKNIGREKVEKMFEKVREDYEKLIRENR